jgi:hypothetical protein
MHPPPNGKLIFNDQKPLPQFLNIGLVHHHSFQWDH